MKNLVRSLGVLSLVAAFSVSSLCAQDEKKEKKEKKGKGDQATQMVTQFLKNLEPAALTADQKTKIEDMFGKVAKEVAMKRTEAGLTAAMLKQRQDATKEGREAGKKKDELKQFVADKVKLTEDQTKVLTETEDALSKVKIEVGKLLSEEQLAKIEDTQFKSSLQAKGKNKKKKAA